MTACKKLNTLGNALIVSAALFATSVWAEESSNPIKIVLNNWSSQQVLAHISGQLLKQMGYNIEYYPADAQQQFSAIGNGDLHFQVEVWEGTMALPFEQQVTRERIIDAGSHQAITREEWWYPDYMEALCPGLPDWKALNACADKLATEQTQPLGRYLAGPVDWERPDRERVEALGLKFDIVNVDDAASLWAQLDTAVRTEQPILLMNWTPNWTEAKYAGKFVEFPIYQAECETEASWGDNPNLTHDCGNPVEGWLKKAVWSGLPEQWSCAFELIQAINLDNAQIAKAAAYAEVDEMNTEEAAKRWLSEHPMVWQQWLPACAETLSLTATTEANTEVAAAETAAAETTIDAEALAKSSNCLSCHSIDSKLVGPAFKDVTAKYKSDAAAAEMLFDKIKNGGTGNWGEIPMPPNPALSDADTQVLVEWILAL